MTSKYLKLSTLRPFSVMIWLLILFASPTFAGGDHYEVYLNKKLVTKQFVTQSATALNLQLDKSNYNDEITIYYSHCGVTGKERSLVLRDSKGKVLKEWKFDDGKNSAAMTIFAREIIDLKTSNSNLNLYYTAKELPKGRMLTSVNLNNKNTAYYQSKQKPNSPITTIALCFLMSVVRV
jgi:hypothetical protein